MQESPVNDEYASQLYPSRPKRALISTFLLFHIVAILSWSLPLNSLLIMRVKEKVTPYMLWSGLFQVWDMFAPEPPMLNSYLEAELIFQNGATALWKFPKMQDMGFAERYFKERHRKWANERLRLDVNAVLWPDASRYIARLYANPANPPVLVRLIRHWSDIPPPAVPGQTGLKPTWNRYVFYTHPVQPGDLQ